MLLPFVPVLLGSQLIIAVADPIPTIDVQNTCRAAAGVFTGTTTQNDVDICVSSEQRARELAIARIHVTLTHTHSMAAAVVVLESGA